MRLPGFQQKCGNTKYPLFVFFRIHCRWVIITRQCTLINWALALGRTATTNPSESIFTFFFKTKRLNPRWRTTITTHVKEKHGGGKREKCPTCDYTTVRKRNLGKHIRSVHEENSVTNVVTKPSWTPRLNWFVFCICVETFINRYRIVRKMYIMKIIRAVHMSDNGPWKDTRCNL